MDFRDISPRSISWTRGGKGAIFASRSTPGPILFQLPRMNATISTHSPGMFRVEFKLDVGNKVHQQFADWIADLEQSAVGTWSSTLKKSNLLYKNGFRIMFFSDTNVFDADGNMTVDFFKAQSVSALCALQGLWTSADKYGLRLNIKQLKLYDDALEYSKDANDAIAPSETPMFVDDD
ncbi:hypothetical protein PBCVNEJV1_522R [Paramecium bursaria Chlorella virus NE-JV-1]|nr:hypothetical protein PBCVNEJV1_522R [Paramecium bursaria Chlorella virus NE-JV-1]